MRRLALIACLHLAGAARALACLPADLPAEDLARAWTFVAAEMDLPPDSPLPAVCAATAEELHARRYGPEGRAALETVALYDARDGGTILLAAAGPGAEPGVAAGSVLVHELVHHAQALRGTSGACPQALEAEAYALQDRWLRDRGGDLEASFGIDRLTLLLLTSCGI